MRVKSMVRSFRDLEVYQKSIQLAIKMAPFGDSKEIPKTIARAYGLKFEDKELAIQEMGKALILASETIATIDLAREEAKGPEKEQLDSLLTKYQRLRTKILNLKRAWSK